MTHWICKEFWPNIAPITEGWYGVIPGSFRPLQNQSLKEACTMSNKKVTIQVVENGFILESDSPYQRFACESFGSLLQKLDTLLNTKNG